MKTIYNFKKQTLLFLLLLMSGFSWGQIVYTGFPTTDAGASNTTGTLTLSGCTTYTGAYLKAYISLINGNQISITTFKQGGNNFDTGNLKIIDANNCTVSLASTTTSTLAGAASKTMIISVSHTNNNYYRVIFHLNSTGLDYYSNEIRILGTAPQPPILKVVSCFNTNASNFNQGDYFSGSIRFRNTPSTQNWTGYISVFLYSPTSGLYYTILNDTYYSISALTSQTINFGTNLNFPSGSYKLYCQYTNTPNGGKDFIDDSNNLCTNDNT